MMISNRTRLALLAITLTASAAALAGCPASFPDICNDDPNCGVDGSAPDGTTGDGAPACDPSKDLSCVTDASGIFINGTSGSDSAAGTKEAPLKTITAALSKATGSKSNLYICAGTYGEHVKLTSAMNLVGGFACADWTYAPANKPKIAPSDVGYALEIESVAGPTSISDLEFDAQPGTTASTSSIAAFVNASPKITLTRVSLSAGAGVQGADGSSSATTTLARGQKGNNASAANGGLALSCPCPDGATVGGGGGNFILGQSNGDAGTPNLSGTSPKDGAGGTGELASCSASGGAGLGHDGADGDAGAAAASAITAGVVDTAGFHPSNGKDGTAGVRGQGGGGGGATTAGTSGAGGGGCGGCGGAFGGGGSGGGASIALVTLGSPVTLSACILSTDAAANGGKGGDGQAGALGGLPGADPATASCNGGLGGAGGNGGAGGGGAGGLSVGIVYKGGAPTADSSTQTNTKTPGHGGMPGTGGTGSGLEGVAQATLEVK